MIYTHEIKRTVSRKVSKACPHWETYVRKGEKCIIKEDNGGTHIRCISSGGHTINVTRKNLREIPQSKKFGV